MLPIITLSNISAGYESKLVIHDINLNVFERDFLGIIGPNGGGKTTLIKLILGLMQPRTGELHFFRSGCEVPALTMGYLPQYNAIDKKFPIAVYEVILSGLSSKKSLMSRFNANHRRAVEQIIVRMGLEGMENRAIGSLSGGQLQRTLLGRAIVSEPDVVILDEPSTYIDRRSETKLYELLTEINRERAIILVSHDIGTVLQNVKTIACVNETLDYHPDTEASAQWISGNFDCPIELLGHGNLPHRVIKNHVHDHSSPTHSLSQEHD